MRPHRHPQHLQLRATFLPLQHPPQHAQRLLHQHQLPEIGAAAAAAGVGEAHVEFDEEGGGAPEVGVGPEGFVADDADAAAVVGHVHDEPDLEHRFQRLGGQVQAFELQQGEDFRDDAGTPFHHCEPA